MTRALTILGCTAALLFTTQASAQTSGEAVEAAEQGPALQLRPTASYAFTKGDRAHGFGLGLELLRYPGSSPLRWGLFGETQAELGGSWRSAAGVSAGYGGFGVQLGLAHRTEGDYAAATMIHIAKTFTWGPVGIAARLGIPVRTYQPSQGPAMQSRGVEFGIVFSAGWSLNVQGERSPWGCDSHHHRRSDDE